MNVVSFDPLRTLPLPAHDSLKPDHFLMHQERIRQADWVLFPEYWQLNTLVFGLKSRIFPSLSSYLIGHDKIEMTRAFELVAPANTPWTLIRANTESAAQEIWDLMPLPFVAKLPKASMGEGVFLIENRADWNHYRTLTDVLYAQEYLPIDRDLRVVWVGDQVLGGYWRVQSERSFHNNVARGGQILEGQIPVAAVELVERVARTLGINYAGFDIAFVDHHPFLLEFNRLFGTQGVRSLLPDQGPVLWDYLARQLADERDPTRPSSPNGPTRRKRRSVRRVA